MAVTTTQARITDEKREREGRTATMNKVPEYNCPACSDQGGWEICHPSTDALIGWDECDQCPPRPPVYKEWTWRGIWKMSPAELAAQPPF
ncbi:hypothetical protein [Streptomyces sp. bgisy153]|uniref:hypothetical protein n=1 Tax=Streptomyces sp. bgisy153 TaxID=3413793 RepID=UPI003D73D98B